MRFYTCDYISPQFEELSILFAASLEEANSRLVPTISSPYRHQLPLPNALVCVSICIDCAWCFNLEPHAPQSWDTFSNY